jgi:Queuine tRNA-ribosyltransferase
MTHSYSHRSQAAAFWIVVVAVLTGGVVNVTSFSLTTIWSSTGKMRSFTLSNLGRQCGYPKQCSIREPRKSKSTILLWASSTNTKAEPGISNITDPDTSNRESCATQTQARPKGPKDRHADFPEWAYQERPFFHFEVIHQSAISQARVGRIHTPHGIIDTPGFVAVATNAALKAVDFEQADLAGQQLIFANTYHLVIHPGSDIIRDAGGIHQWTSRTDRPFITDSGGFQVFSLAYGSVHEELSSKGELKRANGNGKRYNSNRAAGQHSDMVSVTENGVDFRSYRDGSRFLLTPETTVQAQKDIGADIIIPLDELPPYHVDRSKLVDSVDRYVAKWRIHFTCCLLFSYLCFRS